MARPSPPLSVTLPTAASTAAADRPDANRRTLLAAPAAAWLGSAGSLGAAPSPARSAQTPVASAAPPKVMRLALRSAETSFDPAAVSDLYSNLVIGHVFETLYQYDYLARPAKIVPMLADGMPEVSADFRTWTFRVRRGAFFADDPAFGGRPREATAEDAMLAIKRCVDPAIKGPHASDVLELTIDGLEAAQRAARQPGASFDYAAPIAGLQRLDRHTFRIHCAEPRPRLIEFFAYTASSLQAIEVVRAYGNAIGEHPVGTGPFRLVRPQWVRASRIVVERNPTYREVHWDAEPAADDAEGQGMLRRFKGRRLPLVDRVELTVIGEAQPMWLSFLNRQIDGLVGPAALLPDPFATMALPNGQLAPFLAKQGVRLARSLRADSSFMFFNMEDPVVGGLEPHRIALRRAVALGYDVPGEIALARYGQAVQAQSPIMPGTSGYDPGYRSEMGAFDPARANALLDLYGWRDVDGDGFREQPDGSPLTLTISTEPDQVYRTFNDIQQKSLKRIGIRCDFKTQVWASNMKAARGGSLQIWSLGSTATQFDGQGALSYFHGPSAGQANLARFRLPAFDAVYHQLTAIPDGPARDALFREAKRLATVYMPYKILVHRYANELMHPWLHGYRRGQFTTRFWQWVDVDAVERGRATA